MRKVSLNSDLEQQVVNLHYFQATKTMSYANVSCIRTKEIFGVRPTLCYHEAGRDNIVSAPIRKGGVWEENEMSTVLEATIRYIYIRFNC